MITIIKKYSQKYKLYYFFCRLSNEVRQCDYQGEEPPPTPPPVSFNPPKRKYL